VGDRVRIGPHRRARYPRVSWCHDETSMGWKPLLRVGVRGLPATLTT